MQNLSKPMVKEDWATYFFVKDEQVNDIGNYVSEKIIYQGLILEEWQQSFTSFSTADKKIIFRELAKDIHQSIYELFCLPLFPGEIPVVAVA